MFISKFIQIIIIIIIIQNYQKPYVYVENFSEYLRAEKNFSLVERVFATISSMKEFGVDA